jgi:anaerobic selenocysteine-containing dehydrogenase
MQRMRPVIDRVGESRTNDEVAAALAARLGFPAASFDTDPRTIIDRIVVDDGGADGARVLREAGTTVQFGTTFPSFDDHRARLHQPDSELPVPAFQPLDRSGFPLALLSPATNRTINSMLGEVLPAEAVLAVGPADAAARELVDGHPVRVWNAQASLVVPCRVDGSLRPGVVVLPKGLWRRHVSGGLTANALVPDTVNDLAGGACFNDARVEVEAVAEAG